MFSTKIFDRTYKLCKTNRRTPNSGVRYKQPPYDMGDKKQNKRGEILLEKYRMFSYKTRTNTLITPYLNYTNNLTSQDIYQNLGEKPRVYSYQNQVK